MEYELRGKNADLTKILFVGNQPDERVQKCSGENAYQIALMKTKTGETLQEILEFCGLSFEDIYWTNFNRALSKRTRQENITQFDSQLKEFSPRKIVLFGAKSFQTLFPELIHQNSID
jgi:uracil-DNA glycosylase